MPYPLPLTLTMFRTEIKLCKRPSYKKDVVDNSLSYSGSRSLKTFCFGAKTIVPNNPPFKRHNIFN